MHSTCYAFHFVEWLHPERFDRDLTGKDKYIKVCEEMGISPTSYFIKHIRDRELKMKFHGLGPLRMKALAVPLEVLAAVLLVYKIYVHNRIIENI